MSTDATNKKKKREDSVSFTDKSGVYVDKSLLRANPGGSFISTGQDVESHLYNYALFLAFRQHGFQSCRRVLGLKGLPAVLEKRGREMREGSKVLGDGEREREKG